MRLDVLTKDQCEMVRTWRNQCLETLRTPYPLTFEQQEQFYRDVVCNRNSPHRYWGIFGEQEGRVGPGGVREVVDGFLGCGGLTNIQWENRIAEISLILDPNCRGKGLGAAAVDLLFTEAFDRMGLKTVFGECYYTHAGVEFWLNVGDRYNGFRARLPNRKFWAGKFFDSLYFSIDVEEWRKVRDAATD